MLNVPPCLSIFKRLQTCYRFCSQDRRLGGGLKRLSGDCGTRGSRCRPRVTTPLSRVRPRRCLSSGPAAPRALQRRPGTRCPSFSAHVLSPPQDPQGFLVASKISSKCPRFGVTCCPLTSPSAPPYTRRAPLAWPHPGKGLLSSTLFALLAVPCSSLLDSSWGVGLIRDPGPQVFLPLSHSGESCIKLKVSPCLPSS